MKIFAFAENAGPQGLMARIMMECGLHEEIEFSMISTRADQLEGISPGDFDHAIVGLEAFDQTNVEKVIDMFVNVGIRVSVVDDTHNAGLRLSQEYAEKCRLIAAFDTPEYLSEMYEHGYPEVYYHGAPAHWEELYLQATSNAAEGIKPSGKLVLYAGGKDAAFNNKMIRRCVESLKKMDNVFFTIGIHPREKISSDQFVERSKLLSKTQYIGKDKFSTSEMMAIADVTVFADASTLTIGGVFAQKMMIMYYDDEVRENLKSLGAGSRWFVEEFGCMVEVEGPEDLSGGIRSHFLSAAFFTEPFTKSQKENFPLPEKWNQAENIVNAWKQEYASVY